MSLLSNAAREKVVLSGSVAALQLLKDSPEAIETSVIRDSLVCNLDQMPENLRKQLQHRQLVVSNSNGLNEFYLKEIKPELTHAKPWKSTEESLFSSTLTLDKQQLLKQAMEENQLKSPALNDSLVVNSDVKTLRMIFGNIMTPFAFKSAQKDLLPELITKVFNADEAEFGTIQFLMIHSFLTLNQLEQIVSRKPNVLSNQTFVKLMIDRMYPDSPDDFTPASASFIAIKEFCKRLPFGMQGLYTQVLLTHLSKSRSLGKWDFAAFLEYIKIPKQGNCINPIFLQKHAQKIVQPVSLLDPRFFPYVPDAVLREYCVEWFKQNPKEKWEPLSEFLDPEFVKTVYAETRLLHPTIFPDGAKSQTLLKPAALAALKDRCVLEFASLPSNGKHAKQVVVDVKGVDKVSVKIYHLDLFCFYRENPNATDSDLLGLDVSGLVPNRAFDLACSQNPFELVQRSVAVEERGCYLVQIVAKSMRLTSLLRVGELRFSMRSSVAGPCLTLLNEQGSKVAGKVFHQGRIWHAEENGEILLPFSEEGGTILLMDDDICVAKSFDAVPERYNLQTHFLFNRESFVFGGNVSVAVRNALFLGGHHVSLSVLENAVVSVLMRDVHGVEFRKSFPVVCGDDEDVAVEFVLPRDIRAVELSFSAKVDKQDVSGVRFVDINAVDDTSQLSVPVLRKDKHWFLSLLGKNGEAVPGTSLHVSLVLSFTSKMFETTLSTDSKGNIDLGELQGVELVSVECDGVFRSWKIQPDVVLPPSLIVEEGKEIALPIPTLAENRFMLVNTRNGISCRDLSEKISQKNGFKISGLGVGKYLLSITDPLQQMSIQIVPLTNDGLVSTNDGILKVSSEGDSSPLSVSAKRSGEFLELDVKNASPNARIHIFGYNFVPFTTSLPPLSPFTPRFDGTRIENVYSGSETLPAEVEYVMTRSGGSLGNLLRKPGVLLDLREVGETALVTKKLDAPAMKTMAKRGVPQAESYQSFGAAAGMRSGGKRMLPENPSVSDAVNYDFLEKPGFILWNVKDSKISVPDFPFIHVLVVDDLRSASDFVFSKPDFAKRRVSHENAWDVSEHYLEMEEIGLTGTGHVISSLAQVWDMAMALCAPDVRVKMEKWKWILHWHSLSESEKRIKFDEFSSHELHVFLKFKDVEFFQRVLKPYLQHRIRKDVIDFWLLDDVESLSRIISDEYLLSKLNVAEKLFAATAVGESTAKGVVASLLSELKRMEMRPGYAAEKARFKSKLFNIVIASQPSEPQIQVDMVQMDSQPVMEEMAAPPPASQMAMASAPIPMMMARSGRGGFPGARMMAMSDRPNDALDKSRRAQREEVYEVLESTKEYGERWYFDASPSQWKDLVTMGAFWGDFAKGGGKPCLSTNFDSLGGSFTQVMFSLALLPLDKDQSIVFHREFKKADVNLLPSILVSQKYFDPMQRQTFDETLGEHVDKYVDVFRPGKAYGAQVTITNTSAVTHLLSVLRQIPEGAIPIAGNVESRVDTQTLQPFQTVLLDSQFYFPYIGRFKHYPVHVADRRGMVVAHTSPTVMAVVDAIHGQVDSDEKKTWEWNAVDGSLADLLAWLDNDVNVFDPSQLHLLMWRLKDKESFVAIIAALKKRGIYDQQVWAYSLLHKIPEEVGKWARNEPWVQSNSSPYLKGRFMKFDLFQEKEFLEYWPLVNARAHEIGKRPRVNNQQVLETYNSFIRYLFYKQPSQEDLLYLVYLLLLQDRNFDAKEQFQRIKPNSMIQYDYCKAWLAFLDPLGQEPITIALPIAKKYQDYPVLRWNRMFAEISSLIDELQRMNSGQVIVPPSEQSKETLDETRDAKLASKARVEARLDVEVIGEKVTIHYSNLSTVELGFHPMNLEMEFSSRPFVMSTLGQESLMEVADAIGKNPALYVKPLDTLQVTLPPIADGAMGQVTVNVEPHLVRGNVTVEAKALEGELIRTRIVGQSSLNVQVLAKSGMIQALLPQANALRSLPAAYVKVYAKLKDSRVVFYKDGYCDLLGRFDYASLSNVSLLSQVDKFAILVSSPEHGSIVKEAFPPK
jgi:hypothetical protein